MNGRRPAGRAAHYVGVFGDRRYGGPHLRETHRRDQPRVACAEDSESHAHGRTSSCWPSPAAGLQVFLDDYNSVTSTRGSTVTLLHSIPEKPGLLLGKTFSLVHGKAVAHAR